MNSTNPSAFKQHDAESYDLLAEDFDRHSQIYTTYAVHELMTRVQRAPATEVLDLACGTGIVTFALCETLSQASVTGIDLSAGMLAFAKRKAEALKSGNPPRFLLRDAEATELDSESVDLITSLYAFRHFPNPQLAAREAFRLLRPGGRLFVAVGSAPALASTSGLKAAASFLPRKLAQATGRELTACDLIDRLVEQEIPKSTTEITQWAEDEHSFSGSLASLLAEAGFIIDRSDWCGEEHVVQDIEDFWDLQVTFSSIARKRLASANKEQVQAVKAAFWQHCAATQARNGRLVYRVGAAIVEARRPNS